MANDILQSAEESKGEIEANTEIEEGIRTQKLCSVTDASTINNKMGGHQKILNLENHTVARKGMFNKEWGMSIPKAAVAAIMIGMLGFVK